MVFHHTVPERCFQYRSGTVWWNTISGWAYGAQQHSIDALSAAAEWGWPNSVSPHKGNLVTLRIRRASDLMYGNVSLDGGLTWDNNTKSVAAPTGTLLFAVGDSYSGGAQVVLLGRLTVSEP